MMEFVIMKSAYQVTPYFVKTAVPKKGGDVILNVKPNLLSQRVLLPPTTPSSL